MKDTQRLKLQAGTNNEELQGEDLSFSERAMKRRKKHESQCGMYVDVRFSLPTSNLRERFFSTAGHALGDTRKNILPANFEIQIFLLMNSDLWNAEEVKPAIRKQKMTASVIKSVNS